MARLIVQIRGRWPRKPAVAGLKANGKTKILSYGPFIGKAPAMVQRRAQAAGIKTNIGCHTFRATGITIYLTNGVDSEKAEHIAPHESPEDDQAL